MKIKMAGIVACHFYFKGKYNVVPIKVMQFLIALVQLFYCPCIHTNIFFLLALQNILLQLCLYMKKIIITIDGFSSCGKSTLAKQLAKELSYVYVDSGAMYRAITLYFLRNHIDWTDKKEVKKALKEITLEFVHNENSNA